MTRVKICGVTSEEQARACVEAGADAIGVNLVPSSPRRSDERTAARIASALGGTTLVVAIVAGLDVAAMRRVRESTGAGCLQLHGDESPEDVAALLPHAYKAVAVATREDVERAASMPGEYVLVDAKVRGVLGGTGHSVDWDLVAPLAKTRRLVLAGGLTPENVGAAIRRVRPWCVDVASGVERAPGVKDLDRVRAFVQAVRREG